MRGRHATTTPIGDSPAGIGSVYSGDAPRTIAEHHGGRPAPADSGSAEPRAVTEAAQVLLDDALGRSTKRVHATVIESLAEWSDSQADDLADEQALQDRYSRWADRQFYASANASAIASANHNAEADDAPGLPARTGAGDDALRPAGDADHGNDLDHLSLRGDVPRPAEAT